MTAAPLDVVPPTGAYRVKCPACGAARGRRCVAMFTLPAGTILSRWHFGRGERSGVGPWRRT